MANYIHILFTVTASLLAMHSYAMDIPQEQDLTLAKMSHFHAQGEDLGKIYEDELLYCNPGEELTCITRCMKVLDEIKHALTLTTKPFERDWWITSLHLYARGFESKTDRARLARLIASCREILGTNEIEILLEHKISSSKNFYEMVLSFISVKTSSDLEEIIKSYQAKELALLLGYYYEFGKRYGTEFMPLLLTIGKNFKDLAAPFKCEFKNSCEKMMSAMSSNPPTSKKYLDGWMCLHAFSKGVLGAMNVTDIDKHLETLINCQKDTPGKVKTVQGTFLYSTQLRLFDRLADIYSGPIDATEILDFYKKQIDKLSRQSNKGKKCEIGN